MAVIRLLVFWGGMDNNKNKWFLVIHIIYYDD
jgi:hypothetical protein